MTHPDRRKFKNLVILYKNTLGLDVSLTSQGHWKLKNPVTGNQAVVASGSGDPHAYRNAVQLLKSKFGDADIPKTPTQMKNPIVTNVIVTTQPPTPELKTMEEPAPPAMPAPASDTTPETSTAKPIPRPATWPEFFEIVMKDAGLSLVDVAHLLEVSKTSTRRWATGGASPDESRRGAFENLFTMDFSGLSWGQLMASGRKPRTKDSGKNKMAAASTKFVPRAWPAFFAHAKTELSLSDAKIAKAVNSHLSSVSRWKTGKQRPASIRKDFFVKAFPDVDFSNLTWGSDSYDPLARKPKKPSLPRITDEMEEDLPNRFVNPTPTAVVTEKKTLKESDYWAQVAAHSFKIARTLSAAKIDFEDVARFLNSYSQLVAKTS